MHFLATPDGCLQFLFVAGLLGLTVRYAKGSRIVKSCIEPVETGSDDVPMLVLFECIHGLLIHVAGVVYHVDAVLDALGN